MTRSDATAVSRNAVEQVAEDPPGEATIDRAALREKLRKDPYFHEFCQVSYAMILADRARRGQRIPSMWPQPKVVVTLREKEEVTA